MKSLRTRLARQNGVPVLALIDAFIGAIAIILIMIMISEPSDNTPDTVPTADIVVACLDRDTYIAFGGPNLQTPVGDPIPRLDISQRLGAMASASRLTLRVQFIGTASRAGCLYRAQGLLETANQMSELGTDGEPLPVFMTDLRLVETDDMPELPEGDE